MSSHTRPYNQTARAAATADTSRRIVEAFEAAMRDRPMDDITLDQIAAAAGTTRQTIIRLFGGKEGLLQAFTEKLASEVRVRRTVPDRPSPEQAAHALLADYEVVGDFIVRMLAQEARHPVLGTWLNVGRATHRAWIEATFAHALPGNPAARQGQGRCDRRIRGRAAVLRPGARVRR